MNDKTNMNEPILSGNDILKEIEEMAKVIDDRMVEARGYLGSMNKGEGHWIAEKLVEKCYRNCKDKVVLSKEEHIAFISEFNALQHKYNDICDRYRLCKDANETIKQKCAKLIKENSQFRLENNEKEQLAIELMKDIKTLKQLQISDIYTADYQLAMGLITLGYRKVEYFRADECVKKFCETTVYHEQEKLVKENQTLKDQIAELEELCNKTYEDLTKEIDRLEKENTRLTNITPYQVVVSDAKFEELKKNAIEDFNLTKIMLKEFAERLIEKYGYDKLTHETDEDIEIHLTANELDETLKEFINEQQKDN